MIFPIAVLHIVGAIETTIAKVYNADVARWFMSEHGNDPLDPAGFDLLGAGFNVLVFVPTDLTAGISA